MMDSTVNAGMCRCCASEGAFKDIKTSYHWMGEEEVYSDMLRECFDIMLNVSEQGDDGGICEVCITQLRNAINFKKQVLHTEEQFQKHLQNKTLFRPNIVKVELQGDEDSDDNLGSGDEGFSGAEFEVPIKTEVDDPKPKKRAAKASATTTRASAKKAKIDAGETSTKRNQETMGKIRRNKTLEQAVLVIVGPEEKAKLQVNTKPETQVKTRKNELWKHYNNIGHILKCSNATPIQRRGAVGFVCSYCFEEYPDPADLKKHTLAAHTSKTDPTLGYPKIPNMSEYSIKLDITDLKCTICAEPIDSLEDLVTHIQDEHNKKIYSDIPNHFIPFKFSTADFTCCLCDMTFDKFKILQEHMHSHYRNYVCEECNSGFVTRGSYLRHCSTHIKGDFPCRFCPKVYNTLSKKKSHERFNHIKAQMYPNRCTYCDKSFKEYYRKERHMTEVHGAKLPLHKCNACDKIYKNKARLLVHVKRDHLLERRFKCTICDMSFFTSTDVKNHMVTHTGERNFQCGICRKSYGRRTTLSSHMKIHHNDRRFKCEFCGMSFVQKCSWKSHCKSLHGHDVE